MVSPSVARCALGDESLRRLDRQSRQHRLYCSHFGPSTTSKTISGLSAPFRCCAYSHQVHEYHQNVHNSPIALLAFVDTVVNMCEKIDICTQDNTMKLSAIQYKPPKAQTQVARGELLHLVEQSAKQGADIIVCPEMAVSGYVFESKEHIRPHCERADGPTARELAKIAKTHRSWIVCGIAEQALRWYVVQLCSGPVVDGSVGGLLS